MRERVPEPVKKEEGAALERLFVGRNQAQFAKDHSLPGGASMLSQHISGNRPISLKAAKIYSRGLKVNISQFSPRLARVIQSLQSINQEDEQLSVTPIHPEDDLPDGVVAIPEYGIRLSGGNGRPIISYEVEELREAATYRASWLQKERLNPKFLRRFKVAGESMIPLLYPNDVVLVNLEEGGLENVKGGRVYAILYGDDLRVKRLYYQKLTGVLTLKSENPAYQDEILSPDVVRDSITVIGRVRDKSGSGGL